MEKVYLLLRNNQQTGPHSLEELLHLDLKAKDLVWVEGKSCGWSFPTEIDTLKTYIKGAAPTSEPPSQANETTEPSRLASPGQSTAKKIYVSLPGGTVPIQPEAVSQDPIEQKAEELRKRIQSYRPEENAGKQDVHTNYSRKLEDVEEDYTSWVFQKKRKKKILARISPLALGVILLIGLSGAWFLLKPSSTKPDQPPVTSTATPNEQPKDEIQPKVEIHTPPSESPVVTTVLNSGVPDKKTSITVKKVPSKKDQALVSPVAPSVHAPSKSTEKAVDQTTAQNTAVVPPAEEKKDAATTQQQPKEKRTIRGLLNVLFKKNKKEQEADDTRAANTTSNGRNASRRDEEQGATTLDLSDQVQVRSNQSPADWMMGVQGLKLTLYNKSSTQLKNASVEVSYYSEQNDLLQKKTLQFSNIAPQKAQTLSAPDHRLADHVQYNVISATGESSAVAKQ